MNGNTQQVTNLEEIFQFIYNQRLVSKTNDIYESTRKSHSTQYQKNKEGVELAFHRRENVNSQI